MKVFMTGATGFLGGHLIESLVRAGHGVRAIVRPAADISGLRHPSIEVIRGELVDSRSVESAMRDCEIAFHLAATTSRAGKSRADSFLTNLEYTKNVSRAVLRQQVRRLVVCSTAAVYGIVDNPPVDEESPTKENSPYAESKLAAERYLSEAHHDQGLPVVVARFPGVLGRRSLSWVGLFRAIATGHFRVIGSGGNHTHTCHVDDIVQGLQLCAIVPDIEGRTYNLASEQPIVVNDFVAMIAAELRVGISSVRLPALPYQVFSQVNALVYRWFLKELPCAHKYELFISDKVMSIARAQRELGFSPRVPLVTGIRDTLAWYRETGLLA